jgi:hypothetical protein
MSQPKTVDIYEAHESVEAGKVLLVWAYNDESRFLAVQLSGAISFHDFSGRAPSLPKEQSIILYCA